MGLAQGEEFIMSNTTRVVLLMAAVVTGLTGISHAQTPAPSPAPAATPPLFATTKVEGTDNVYVFRYQNHQAMFVVTPAGVIVTDPIGYGRPEAVKTYLDEVRKITQAPIKYLIYSHITTITSPAASRSRMPAPSWSRTAAPGNDWRR